MHCRDNLFFVYKLCCLSFANHSSIPTHFAVILPHLVSDVGEFDSSVRSIQSSLSGVPNVSGLFLNPRTISPILSLHWKGKNLLDDAVFSVWDITSSCSSRQRRLHNKFESRYIRTISDEETLWTSVVVSPRPPVQTWAFRIKFVQLTPFPTRSTTADSPVKHRGSSPKLSTATFSVPRVSADVSFLPDANSNQVKKLMIKKKDKKNSSDK